MCLSYFQALERRSRCSKELGERLFKHARLKVSAALPLVRIISARLLAALYMPLMSYTMPLHHEDELLVPPRRRKK